MWQRTSRQGRRARGQLSKTVTELSKQRRMQSARWCIPRFGMLGQHKRSDSWRYREEHLQRSEKYSKQECGCRQWLVQRCLEQVVGDVGGIQIGPHQQVLAPSSNGLLGITAARSCANYHVAVHSAIDLQPRCVMPQISASGASLRHGADLLLQKLAYAMTA
jgi:hypothetical protein